MKRLFFVSMLSMVFLSCQNEYKHSDLKTVCGCKEKEKASEFVQNSIKNANNMSDEEMEDVIRELTFRSFDLYCHQEQVEYIYNTNNGDSKLVTKLDSCESVIW